METILLIGASGHAKVLIDIIECARKYKIAGLLDRDSIPGRRVQGYEVLGNEEELPVMKKEYGVTGLVIAIGDNYMRAEVYQRVSKICPDLSFVKAIHPSALVSKSATIGEGTVIMAGVTVNPSSTIGRFCILNTQSSLDHDSAMDDFSSLAPGVVLGGNCKIGKLSAICIGAVVIHGIHVGENSVVGAGAIVLENIEPNKLAYGIPAKPVSDRKSGDLYL